MTYAPLTIVRAGWPFVILALVLWQLPNITSLIELSYWIMRMGDFDTGVVGL